jgi:hypothetical protein
MFGITPEQPIVYQIQQSYFWDLFSASFFKKCSSFSILMNFTSESRNNSERNTPRANAKNG